MFFKEQTFTVSEGLTSEAARGSIQVSRSAPVPVPELIPEIVYMVASIPIHSVVQFSTAIQTKILAGEAKFKAMRI
jgi:hypothetical protein